MAMKFTLKPNGEVVLEWEKNGEKKKAELTSGIKRVDINHIERYADAEVTLTLRVNDIDVQYDTKHPIRLGNVSGESVK